MLGPQGVNVGCAGALSHNGSTGSLGTYQEAELFGHQPAGPFQNHALRPQIGLSLFPIPESGLSLELWLPYNFFFFVLVFGSHW